MKNILKTLRIIIIICLIILLGEAIYFTYNRFFKEKESIYFDAINSVATYKDGYVTVGSNNNNDKHYEKAKLTKYDSNSKAIIEVLYNKGYNSAFFDVVEDLDTYIAVGSYEKTSKEHERSNRSALIVKYDTNGDILFERNLEVLDNSKFVGVSVVEDGYIVVGMSVYDSMTLGFSSQGGAVIVKYDKVGNLVWQNNYGSNKNAIYNDVVEADGYLYAVGKDENTGIISKYSLDGELINTNTYEYVDSLGFTSIVNSNNSLIVSGAKKNLNTTDKVLVDALIVKYNYNLKYMREVRYNLGKVERFNRIITDSDNNLIVVGNIVNSDGSGVNTFLYDGIIAKYTNDLTLIKSEIYSEHHDDYFTGIDLKDNNYLVVGYSSYENGSYLGKSIVYSKALKVLEVS